MLNVTNQVRIVEINQTKHENDTTCNGTRTDLRAT